MQALKRAMLEVKKSPIHGYGVFAVQDIARGDVIEEAPMLLPTIYDKRLSNYYFEFLEKSAIVLGYGCLYNHSPQPNADYDYDQEKRLCIMTANRPIKSGEEIFIHYGENWFAERKLRLRKPSPWFTVRHAFSSKTIWWRMLLALIVLVGLVKLDILTILKILQNTP